MGSDGNFEVCFPKRSTFLKFETRFIKPLVFLFLGIFGFLVFLEEHQAAESDDQKKPHSPWRTVCSQKDMSGTIVTWIAWLFLIMINNLNAGGVADMWKCVDDTTISKLVDKGGESCI